MVKHYAPAAARFYRLRDLHSGNLLPKEGRAARVYDPVRVEIPEDVTVGTFQILYYKEAFDLGSILTPRDGQQPPTIVYSDDGVLMTPADWERSEEAKHYQLERRDLSIRRETALTRTIEAQGNAVERLSSHIIERDAAITENQVAINKLQVEMFGLMRELMQQSRASTDAQGDALVNASRKIAEAVNNIKTDNVATVGVEFVKQASTVLQAYVASRSQRASELTEERPHLLEVVPVAAAKLPAADPPRAQATEPSPRVAQAPTPATAPAQSRALPADLMIQWDDLFSSMDEAPPSEAPAALAVPDGDPIEPPTNTPAASDEEPTQEAALGPLAPGGMPDFSALFALLGLRAPVVRPRASEWSPAWAVRKIKERIASLSEVSIVWLLSSWQNALSYLRELADIARPPDPALLAEEGSS